MNERHTYSGRSLDESLKIIDDFFGIRDLLKGNISKKQIQSYYRASSWAYRMFHSKDGAVHMAINYDGKFNPTGYYTAPNEIGDYIEKNVVRKVVEFGCGKGFNSIHLAKKFPETEFIGFDITEKHLEIAKKNSQNHPNLSFKYGDFQSIDLPDNFCDIVFETEAICHAHYPEKVIQEAFRILKPGGLFILYEGFRTDKFYNENELMLTAGRLIEKTMAVNEFANENVWIQNAVNSGFITIENKDLSNSIMPNLLRLNNIANRFFEKKVLSTVIKILLPQEMLMNSVAGLLMPYGIENEVFKYRKIVLEKGR